MSETKNKDHERFEEPIFQVSFTRKRKLLFFVLVLFVFLPVPVASFTGVTLDQRETRDQEVAWLKDHIIPLRSIDPQDEDFSDLAPLVKVLGSVRIVQLGENTHGDGTAFLAKGRLIRFLHQVMGFDVLAWEAGFFDCRLLDAALRSNIPIHEVAQKALYQVWSQSAEVMPVMEYARSTQKTPLPMTIAGFDCRVSTRAARENSFPGFIFSFFDKLDPNILSQKDREDFRTMSIRLVPVDYYKYPEKRHFNQEVARRLVKVLDRDKTRMLSYASAREIEYVRQSLVSFLNMARALQESGSPPKDNQIKDRYSRDTAMAENILWLCRTYFPDRKIIIWAHNYHIMKDLAFVGLYPGQYERFKKLKNVGPHGRFLNRQMGDRVYTIGITGYQGSWGYVGEESNSLAAPEPGSLGDLFHQVNQPFCFLDFRGLSPSHWLRQPLSGRFSFWESQKAYWTQLYDGVLFIDTMSPVTPVNK
ncbi:MAG: erythromycin esterase family protein [Candidatus Aminicenantes bacterium]|nr:MAG: erythromycin esterase family protein [Candidatus Aminicenantes bacterium]